MGHEVACSQDPEHGTSANQPTYSPLVPSALCDASLYRPLSSRPIICCRGCVRVQLSDYLCTPFACRQKLALHWRLIYGGTLRDGQSYSTAGAWQHSVLGATRPVSASSRGFLSGAVAEHRLMLPRQGSVAAQPVFFRNGLMIFISTPDGVLKCPL
jgi:hypothetical protein